MREHAFEWLVDRERMHEDQSSSSVNLKEPGVTLKIDRIALENYASVDMTFIKTDEPFELVPVDTSHGRSERAISFLSILSGAADGMLPSGERVSIDRQWGLLTDFADGTSRFTIQAGEPLRCFGASLSLPQIQRLFEEHGHDGGLTALLSHIGMVRSFRSTAAMRTVTHNALNCGLTGPLQRLFLEGAALQMFALIFHQELPPSLVNEEQHSRLIANKSRIKEAERLLTKNLSHPPSMIELSEKTGLSARQINDGFKELFAMTAYEYLSRKRMLSAKELLEENPEFPLKVLAFNMGYRHVSNFITAFKREFGSTPSHYAKGLLKRL